MTTETPDPHGAEAEPMPPEPKDGADVTAADGPQEPDLDDLDGQAAQVDADLEED